MSENASGLPGPSEEHQRLLDKVGNWNVHCRYFMNPSEPIEAHGTDRVEALGGFWTLGRFHCDVMGTAIDGLATTGYDPKRGKYVGSWRDSSNPYTYTFEGEIIGETLEMEGDNVDPMSGQLVKYRSVETLGKDERTLELFIHPEEGDPIQILRYEYTRT